MSASDFSPEELKEFHTEATELLDSAEQGLLALSKGGAFQVHYDAVFRVFHSLKGAAGMLGIGDLQTHMHSLENILSNAKKNDKLTDGEINLFLKGVDAARKVLAGERIDFVYEVTQSSQTQPPKTPGPAPDSAPVPVPSPVPVSDEEKQKDGEVAFREGLAYLVDDEPEILTLLEKILNSGGIETKAFTDPQQLIDELPLAPPDLVITDMKMPGLSGVDVLRLVKEVNPDIPVIFVSGYLDKSVLLEAIHSGVFSAIEKPFNHGVVLSYSLSAIRQARTMKMLNRSLNLVLYQFSDLEDFLKSQGKGELVEIIRHELNTLMEQRRQMRSLKAGERGRSDEL